MTNRQTCALILSRFEERLGHPFQWDSTEDRAHLAEELLVTCTEEANTVYVHLPEIVNDLLPYLARQGKKFAWMKMTNEMFVLRAFRILCRRARNPDVWHFIICRKKGLLAHGDEPNGRGVA